MHQDQVQKQLPIFQTHFLPRIVRDFNSFFYIIARIITKSRDEKKGLEKFFLCEKSRCDKALKIAEYCLSY